MFVLFAPRRYAPRGRPLASSRPPLRSSRGFTVGARPPPGAADEPLGALLVSLRGRRSSDDSGVRPPFLPPLRFCARSSPCLCPVLVSRAALVLCPPPSSLCSSPPRRGALGRVAVPALAMLVLLLAPPCCSWGCVILLRVLAPVACGLRLCVPPAALARLPLVGSVPVPRPLLGSLGCSSVRLLPPSPSGFSLGAVALGFPPPFRESGSADTLPCFIRENCRSLLLDWTVWRRGAAWLGGGAKPPSHAPPAF